MLTFGPVPSRRLGRSLGINNIPPKVCTYGCVYCQVGRTLWESDVRRPFHSPDLIANQVERRLEQVRRAGDRVDVLCFVPDGEPTLDRELASEIDFLRPLDIPVAVISNGSLTPREDVRDALSRADVVSLKVDTVRERVWRRLNRPHAMLGLTQILAGMRRFADEYEGRLLTETMLVEGVNDSGADLEAVASFLAELRPAAAYLSVPTRPPTEPWARAPSEAALTAAWHTLARRLDRVECLTGYEGDDFAPVGRIDENILGITAVHPLRKEALTRLLDRSHASPSVVRKLLESGDLAEVKHGGHTYFVRRFPGPERSARPAIG
jgi:wyosine [tRNA(Phe)-imidazoG37] synthetase (radical SAM superfamily)